MRPESAFYMEWLKKFTLFYLTVNCEIQKERVSEWVNERRREKERERDNETENLILWYFARYA